MKLIEMNAKQFTDLLNKLNACCEAKDFAKDKTALEVIETCYRGDWLLWLYKRIAPNDLQKLTLVKGYCANTVRHLMKDERSKNAVDVAIKFGEGNATKEELNSAASAASCAAAYAYAADDAAADAAAADAATAYAYAAYAADAAAADAYAASAASCASYAASYAAYAAYAAAYAARKENRLLTANLCRKYLPFMDVEL